jgi:F-type H+-transporting ATPase subunit delta
MSPPYGSLNRFVTGGKFVISSAILGRYARSLADVVFEDKIEDIVAEDLKAFDGIFRAVPDVLEALDSPAIPRESKEKLLAALMKQYPVNPITANFLQVLLQHNRIRHFSQILNEFLNSVNERKGIVSAKITAAVPLLPEEVTRIQKRLAIITGKQVNIESQTDEDLLGGVVVQIGSTVYDGSIRTQLADMKRRLMET